MRNRRHRYNIHGLILCGLVFFVIAATAFCMVANSKEAEREQKRIEAEKKLKKRKRKPKQRQREKKLKGRHPLPYSREFRLEHWRLT